MTKEEKIAELINIRDNFNYTLAPREVFDDAIKALEQEPCEEAISRQVAIDAFERFIHELGIKDEPYNYGEMALSVQNVPSIKPQVKTGHWIELGCVGNDNYNFECSECHHTDTQSKAVKVNYCWYCGAKMVEPQESEDKE